MCLPFALAVEVAVVTEATQVSLGTMGAGLVGQGKKVEAGVEGPRMSGGATTWIRWFWLLGVAEEEGPLTIVAHTVGPVEGTKVRRVWLLH